MLAWLLALITSLFTAGIDVIETILGYIQTAVNFLIEWVVSFLPDSVMDGSFLGIDWNVLYSLGDALFYIFPFTSLVAIFATTYAVMGSIRLVRWCIGFVPTIEG